MEMLKRKMLKLKRAVLKRARTEVARYLVVPIIILLLVTFNWLTAGPPSPGSYLGGLLWYEWAGGLALFALVGAAVTFSDARWELRLLRAKFKRAPVDEPQDAELLKMLEKYGSGGPNYPHPIIIPKYCIGCRACVEACPQSVLTMAKHYAVPARRDLCVEELTCQAVCPVDPKACVVVNTTKKPPRQIKPERDGTTYIAQGVPGCYIIGSVAGSPLIKRAANEGAQVIRHIAEELKEEVLPPDSAVKSVAIIGLGPGGFFATVTAKKLGLSYVAIEQDKVLSTIRSYPKYKQVFFRPDDTDWDSDLPLKGKSDKRERLLEECDELMKWCGDNIKEGESCLDVIPSADGGHFVVRTVKGDMRESCEYTARRVVIAVGKNSARRMLKQECIEPGTANDRVLYRLTDPEDFKGKRVAVIGGGNSAVEAAIALVGERDGEEIEFYPKEEAAEVSLLVRGDFTKDLQFENKMLINYCFDEGRVTLYFGATVEKVRPGEVVIRDSDKQERSIPNDYVLAMIGADYPKAFLKNIGIHVPGPEDKREEKSPCAQRESRR